MDKKDVILNNQKVIWLFNATCWAGLVLTASFLEQYPFLRFGIYFLLLVQIGRLGDGKIKTILNFKQYGLNVVIPFVFGSVIFFPLKIVFGYL